MSDSAVLSLAKDLIRRVSVTPEDAGCQQMMIAYLEVLGFKCETMVFNDTTNLWARRGTAKPLFCFAGHTDVVPTGPLADWHTPPFEPTVIDGYLHGRGAADMKGSIAAFMVAVKQFIEQHDDHQGSIAFLITSDEEGPFINGTIKVIEVLEARHEKIDYCIVGEPSSTREVGDIVKNGRRGSLTGDLVIKGIQGHIAYPHLVDNPIHKAGPVIGELSQKVWDNGNEFFPPTSFQFSNLQSGTGASNIVPGALTAQFNFRYSTECTAAELVSRTHTVLDAQGIEYELNWTYNGVPFITGEGELIDAVKAAIKEVTKFDTELSTSGGTSDGRFIAPTGAQLVELGPINATIHKVNECVKIADLEKLVDMYRLTLTKLLSRDAS